MPPQFSSNRLIHKQTLIRISLRSSRSPKLSADNDKIPALNGCEVKPASLESHLQEPRSGPTAARKALIFNIIAFAVLTNWFSLPLKFSQKQRVTRWQSIIIWTLSSNWSSKLDASRSSHARHKPLAAT